MKGRKLQNPSTSSPLLGFFSKSGNAAPITTIPVLSPLPVVLSRGAMLLCKKSNLGCLVTSSLGTFY